MDLTMRYSIAKCIVIGDSGVGKTSITQRLVNGLQHPMKADKPHDVTIGVDFDTYYSRMRHGDPPRRVKMQIWDTAGQECFKAIIRSYYTHANICFIVYDVSNRSSYMNVPGWHKELTSKIDDTLAEQLVIVLCANKTDTAHRVVSLDEGEEFAIENGLLYTETSALTSVDGIIDTFEMALSEYVRRNGLQKLRCVEVSDHALHGGNNQGIKLGAGSYSGKCAGACSGSKS